LAYGSAILTHSPFYFSVVFAASVPLIYGDFKVVNLWWATYARQTPYSKKKSVLVRAYHNPEAFVQAHMFNQGPKLRSEIDQNDTEVRGMYDGIRMFILKKEFLNYFLGFLAFMIVLVHVVWSTAAGLVSLGALTVLIASAKQFQSGIEGFVSQLADQWNSARGVILIERDFMGLESALKTECPIVPNFAKPPRIVFDKVCFAYPEQSTLVLKDISLTIEPCMKLAIVGKSGSGKSSLFSLLARHYDPTSGSISADGIPLTRIDPRDWFRFISGLTQDYAILDRTVEGEIASSRLEEELDQERVAEASRFADFDSVALSNPQGFQAQIGTQFGGREFSGGEKQRLAIARVKYRETSILILDEPDSRLDPETAEKVMNSIFALKGVTVVIITHHVSRAARCDHIALMDEGQIAEFGTHAELMDRGGKYLSMFTKDKERLAGS
jgi:ABC-type multidrug transport system fused ATPase/permease subunit